jgi:hypothetical protein
MRHSMLTAAIAAAVSLAIAILTLPFAGRASQNALGLPTTGVFSGLSEQNSINNALDALLTCNSGSAAPTNALGGAPKEGQCWLDTTSATLKIKKRYSGSGWVIEGVIDVTNGLWIPAAGGGSGTVASAATTDLCISPQQMQTVSGTVTITSFGSSCVVGTRRTLIFSGAAQLTYNVTSLILPGQVSYTTAANDVIEAIYLGSSNWRITAIDRINGQAVVNPSVDVGTMLMSAAAAAPSKYVFGFGQALTRTSFPDYLAAVTRAQLGTATSGNPTLTSVADTSGMGAGMPVEGSCLPAGTTIASVTGSSITASANATTNGSCSVTVFFTGYGSGGTSASVGVPDCRGRVLAGRDDLGGTAASRLTVAGFGTGATQLNAAGSSAETTALLAANIPTITASNGSQSISVSTGGANIPNVSNTITNFLTTGTGSGSSAMPLSAGVNWTSINSLTGTNSITATYTNASPTPPRVVQPTLTANCIVRVLAFNFPPANDQAPIALGREPIALSRRFA